MQLFGAGTCARYGRPAKVAGTAIAVAAAAAAAGCSAGSSGPASQVKAAAAAAQASVTILPSAGGRAVQPGGGVTVRADHGRLGAVTVTTSQGHLLAGVLADNGTVWKSNWALQPSARYTVRATATGANGQRVTATSTFRTLSPKRTVQVTLLEANHQKYGVGMPISLTFNHAVTNRKAVERSLSITTSRPVMGAWYWDTNTWAGTTTVSFRPKSYWQPGTKVSFTGHLAGVEIAKGVYATHNLHASFSIGPSLIVKASTVTHYMDVYYKGRLFGHWPISTGRPGDDTPNGHYLTIEKANPTYMTGPGYALWVPWAVRFTWSGVYIHDAYWSVWAQGSVNVSHGCVNTSPAHAETYYKMELPGDPVIVTGSPRAGTWDNGWTEWFLSWRNYLRGSALHAAVVAGPTGSTFVDASTVVPPAMVGPRGHGLA
ncbi:MAG TPA: Ig-like domain-containing protein [Streptosporangiaceae bacterium]